MVSFQESIQFSFIFRLSFFPNLWSWLLVYNGPFKNLFCLLRKRRRGWTIDILLSVYVCEIRLWLCWMQMYRLLFSLSYFSSHTTYWNVSFGDCSITFYSLFYLLRSSVLSVYSVSFRKLFHSFCVYVCLNGILFLTPFASFFCPQIRLLSCKLKLFKSDFMTGKMIQSCLCWKDGLILLMKLKI